MAKYRKKPVIVEAFKWTGGPDQTEDPEWIVKALKKPQFQEGSARIVQINPSDPVQMEIFTSEGRHNAKVGDYIIQGIKGEIYPCKPDIFEQTYELVKVCSECDGSGLKTIENNIQLDDPCEDCQGSGVID